MLWVLWTSAIVYGEHGYLYFSKIPVSVSVGLLKSDSVNDSATCKCDNIL